MKQLMNSLSDEELVKLHLMGDNSCFSVLYERFYVRIFNKCFTFTKDFNDAFDYTQDILMKAFDKLKTFKGNSKFSTWIYAIAHNYCIENYRKKNNIVFEPLNEINTVNESIEFGFMDQHQIIEEEVQFALSEISESDRILLELKYSHNYSIKDIQDSYNLSASAVKMRLQRARQKIERIYIQRQLIASA